MLAAISGQRADSSSALYLPLLMAAVGHPKAHRLYLALDTTVLWDRFCMIHLSVCCCGRALPLLWRVLEHNSATVAFAEYPPLLRKARWLVRHHPDVMLLADRGFANHQLLSWLDASPWHYCLRLPCDALVQGVRRYATPVGSMYPPPQEAWLYRNVRLWADGRHRTNLVLATVPGAKESWAVGLLYATVQGMAVQMAGLQQQVDPHWRRGLSYLKIGLRWLRGVMHKGRHLLQPIALLFHDPQPCFASKWAEQEFYDQFWFTRIRSLTYKP